MLGPSEKKTKNFADGVLALFLPEARNRNISGYQAIRIN